MKTIVYQSYRTTDVPAWVQTCLHSARDWAASRGFEYRFFDDRFFDYCPPWYREKVGKQVLLLRIGAVSPESEEYFDRSGTTF